MCVCACVCICVCVCVCVCAHARAHFTSITEFLLGGPDSSCVVEQGTTAYECVTYPPSDGMNWRFNTANMRSHYQTESSWIFIHLPSSVFLSSIINLTAHFLHCVPGLSIYGIFAPQLHMHFPSLCLIYMFCPLKSHRTTAVKILLHVMNLAWLNQGGWNWQGM